MQRQKLKDALSFLQLHFKPVSYSMPCGSAFFLSEMCCCQENEISNKIKSKGKSKTVVWIGKELLILKQNHKRVLYMSII